MRKPGLDTPASSAIPAPAFRCEYRRACPPVAVIAGRAAATKQEIRASAGLAFDPSEGAPHASRPCSWNGGGRRFRSRGRGDAAPWKAWRTVSTGWAPARRGPGRGVAAATALARRARVLEAAPAGAARGWSGTHGRRDTASASRLPAPAPGRAGVRWCTSALETRSGHDRIHADEKRLVRRVPEMPALFRSARWPGFVSRNNTHGACSSSGETPIVRAPPVRLSG